MTKNPDAFNDDVHIFRSEKFKSVVQDAVGFFANTPLHPLPPTSQLQGIMDATRKSGAVIF